MNHYSNHISATYTDTEVILDFRLKSGKGRPQEQARIILPHSVAEKLGALLTPTETKDNE